MKTGILVHGLNLGAVGWKDNAWGRGKTELGRIPMGAYMAMKTDAEIMIFGTGASEKGGVKEGEYSMNYLMDRLDDLPYSFKGFRGKSFCTNRIQAISQFDHAAHNTRGEILSAFTTFQAKGIKRMVLVSCPTHLPRCLRDACDIGVHLEMDLMAVPSAVCYAGAYPSDVQIKEPPYVK